MAAAPELRGGGCGRGPRGRPGRRPGSQQPVGESQCPPCGRPARRGSGPFAPTAVRRAPEGATGRVRACAHVHVCKCVRAWVCACVCVRARARGPGGTGWSACSFRQESSGPARRAAGGATRPRTAPAACLPGRRCDENRPRVAAATSGRRGKSGREGRRPFVCPLGARPRAGRRGGLPAAPGSGPQRRPRGGREGRRLRRRCQAFRVESPGGDGSRSGGARPWRGAGAGEAGASASPGRGSGRGCAGSLASGAPGPHARRSSPGPGGRRVRVGTRSPVWLHGDLASLISSPCQHAVGLFFRGRACPAPRGTK